MMVLEYYSQDKPVSRLELDMIRFNYPSDYSLEHKSLDYRAEKRVYLVNVDTVNKKITVGVKE